MLFCACEDTPKHKRLDAGLGGGRVARHEGFTLAVSEDASLTAATLGQEAAGREDA